MGSHGSGSEARSFLEQFRFQEDLDRPQAGYEGGQVIDVTGDFIGFGSYLLFRQIVYLYDFKIHMF